MKKQTAVQYFASKVMYLNISPKEMHEFLEWFEESRKMEKEQIEDAFDIGFCEGFDFGFRDFDPTYESGEKYYNETFK
jgi:hypothetical protein